VVQVLSIVLSFILYAKPVHWMHWVGGAVFIMSIVITIYLAGNKRPKHTYTAVATAEPSKDPEEVEATPQTSL
jgi:multidrug efflux pump subunit AcrA (membrane-fusion protein)